MAKKKESTDINELAFGIVDDLTSDEPPKEEPAKNPAAVERGRKGGKIGGKARADSLSADKKKEIAKKAAKARWGK